jgi:transposase InsO family protein
MAAAISPWAGRAYGVAGVCDGFGVARSSFYAWQRQQERIGPTPSPSRRGPKPAIPDASVLSAIRADLARSPWIGEGHRKVWARLRVLDGLRVARKRVLRLMRENGLLSPHRQLPNPGEAHDGRITTDAPNLMWGTDATQIPTVLDGKVWLFAVVEHWNAEGIGWHVAKIGNRYAAAQAVGMAVKSVFGAVAGALARGVAIRHDHGSSFMSDHFQNQIKFWGMTPSFAFVREPETNGVAERFFRTFKEQVVHGRIYQTIDDVRAAAREFFERYNAEWLIGVSSEGHAVMSVKVRPEPKDSGFEAREAPWRESKTAEPSDNMLERSVREASGCNVQ